MTDDFQLFADPDDGDHPIDPDVALVSAYLARELSPLQMLALEERLATDAAFRASMQPLIDLWAAPVPSLEDGAAHRPPSLSAQEKSEGWQRFLGEQPTSADTRPNIHRRVSMKRIAAVIGLAVLPMVSFAQVVVHAANNADAPGHHIARRIVAPFVDESQTPKPPAPPRRPKAAKVTPTAPLIDAPAAMPVQPAPGAVDVASAAQAQRAAPDRARIAELARQHHPAVARGDTAVEYIVMVLDAADNYVWSTIGSGNVSIEVAGDQRTPEQRLAFNREYRAEFWGAGGPGGRGGRGIATPSLRDAQDTLLADLRNRVQSGIGRVGVAIRSDSLVQSGGGGRGRGGAGDSIRTSLFAMRGDSVYRLRVLYDSARAFELRRGGRGRGGGGGAPGLADSVDWVRFEVLARGAYAAVGDSATRFRLGVLPAGAGARGGGGGGRGRIGGSPDSASVAGASVSHRYTNGWSGTQNGPLFNQASGLTERTPGQSGIDGLPSTSLASADLYFYAEGELAPRFLKVMVVHLAPGIAWSGR